jgi:two-component system chemotaxis response regulator CheY
MRRILVVEDSAATRALVRACLEDPAYAARLDGIEVVEATCGFDAMRVLPRQRFDLVVTDINMADINGLELIHFVRRSEHHRGTPLVIISTQAAQRDVDRGLALGANAYVPKPFRPEELQAICERLLLTAVPATSSPSTPPGS